MDLEMDATCERRIARFYAILKSLQFIFTMIKDSLDNIVK